MTIPKSVRRQVDELGELKASIALLEAKANVLIRKLKERGLGVYSGSLFDANVFSSTRYQVDWKGIAGEVGFTEEQKQQYTTVAHVVTCKVTARLTREAIG